MFVERSHWMLWVATVDFSTVMAVLKVQLLIFHQLPIFELYFLRKELLWHTVIGIIATLVLKVNLVCGMWLPYHLYLLLFYVLFTISSVRTSSWSIENKGFCVVTTFCVMFFYLTCWNWTHTHTFLLCNRSERNRSGKLYSKWNSCTCIFEMCCYVCHC